MQHLVFAHKQGLSFPFLRYKKGKVFTVVIPNILDQSFAINPD